MQTLKTIFKVRTGSQRGVQMGPGDLNGGADTAHMSMRLLFQPGDIQDQLSSSAPLLAISCGITLSRVSICHSISEEIQMSVQIHLKA